MAVKQDLGVMQSTAVKLVPAVIQALAVIRALVMGMNAGGWGAPTLWFPAPPAPPSKTGRREISSPARK